jgi:hypothetical protein
MQRRRRRRKWRAGSFTEGGGESATGPHCSDADREAKSALAAGRDRPSQLQGLQVLLASAIFLSTSEVETWNYSMTN